ncbi:hypothetical protein QFW77_12885 [Luteimonas sp. RD2P54]|uniref:Uncharacterized protein n=1 Tax=Luteimonas endophytica TaxID=3042023 RepID=A0ABT6JCE8_9GAMM|nr:hypothetical protein [Luteimonas endophytica]MDH5823873.1 hypothetical protein [Luteimonas endophytica]
MKRLLIASALLGMAFAVAAQEPEPEEQAEDAAPKASERFCITETGSRVVASRNARNRQERDACVAAGGRVYTRAELESTGEVDIADALRRLDPSIR